MSQINIDAAYYEFLNSDETRAPESVTTGYSELRSAFDHYLEALTEYEWKAGFSYAVKMMEEREVCRDEKN